MSNKNSLRDRYKYLKKLNEKLIREDGELREEKKEVHQILNCENDESLKQCSKRKQESLLYLVEKTGELHDELDVTKSILDNLKLENQEKVNAFNLEKSANLKILEKNVLLGEEIEKLELEHQEGVENLNSERLFNLEIVKENNSLTEEIEKAHTTLGCGGLGLGECAERKIDEFKNAQENNEKLLYRNKDLFEENATLTDRGYKFAAPSPPSSPPTGATRRTANKNNKYFRPGTVDAARYPPYPGFPM